MLKKARARFNLRKRSFTYLILLVITFSAFLIRLYYSKFVPVWADEANLVIEGERQSILNLFLLNYWDTAHPPLYNIFVKYWTNVGTYPTILRLPSIISGSLSLIVLYKLVSEFTNSETDGLIAAFISAFSGFLIILSIYSRPYGFQQTFILLFIYFFLRFFKYKKITFKSAVYLFLLSVIATLTDYSFLWVLTSSSLLLTILIGLELYRLQNKLPRLKKLRYSPSPRAGSTSLFTAPPGRSLNKHRLMDYLTMTVSTLLPFILWSPVFFSKSPSALEMASYISGKLPAQYLLKIGYTLRQYIFIELDFISYTKIFFVLVGISVLLIIKQRDYIKKIALTLSLFILMTLAVSALISHLGIYITLAKNIFVVIYPIIILATLFVSSLFKRNKISGVISLVIILYFQNATMPMFLNAQLNRVYLPDVLLVRSRLYEKFRQNQQIDVILDKNLSDRQILIYYLKHYDLHKERAPVSFTLSEGIPENLQNSFVLLSASGESLVAVEKFRSLGYYCPIIESESESITAYHCGAI